MSCVVQLPAELRVVCEKEVLPSGVLSHHHLVKKIKQKKPLLRPREGGGRNGGEGWGWGRGERGREINNLFPGHKKEKLSTKYMPHTSITSKPRNYFILLLKAIFLKLWLVVAKYVESSPIPTLNLSPTMLRPHSKKRTQYSWFQFFSENSRPCHTTPKLNSEYKWVGLRPQETYWNFYVKGKNCFLSNDVIS